MSAKRFNKALAVLALVGIAANANAQSSVSVTGEFTRFTVDEAYLNLPTNVNGVQIDDGSKTTGITTAIAGSSVTFDYDSLSNSFSFSGNTANVLGTGTSNEFVLGRFTYTNGFFHRISFLDFTLTTHSENALYDNHSFNGRISLKANFNGGTPEEGADYFTVQDSAGATLTSLGSVRVYDWDYCPESDPTAPNCNTGSVDVIGHIGSLHLDRFENAAGGAFIDGSVAPGLAPIPEPETYAMMLAGLGLLGFVARRRKHSKVA
ncbi:MAG: PEP-CTERM sorting domain-containing protein [Propionivibrio sp.]|nr:PEP-CTERM sorting domain-containing protein [Propionivibrio sp.]